MAFVERQITVSFSYHGDGGGLNNITFSGLRVSAQIKYAGHVANSAVVKIYGLSLDHLNALTKVPALATYYGNNTVKVMAGDKNNGMSLVFEGIVIQSWPDMSAAPEVCLRVDAVTGSFESVKPAEPSSYTGSTDVAKVWGDLAGKAGLSLENNGVNMKINSPYFWGTTVQQMKQLSDTTRNGWVQENGKLAIWPQNGARTSAGTVDVSKETGMVGYPYAVPGMLVVSTLFNKAIKYASVMRVKSDIKVANASWMISNIDMNLESQTPNGSWYATLFGVKYGG